MKYEKEIDEIMKSLLYEDWMDEKDLKEIINLSFQYKGITKQDLSDKLEEGVNLGHPIEEQIKLIKTIFQLK